MSARTSIGGATWTRRDAAAAGFAAIGLPTATAAQPEPQRAFEAWARRARVAPDDTGLARLASRFRRARVVTLGEAGHGMAEVLSFRNRLFRGLVLRHGFTGLAMESGFVEAQAADDYVQGRTDDLDGALRAGLSWTFDRFPQNRALLRWMRERNARVPAHRRISFLGFDLPGSPGNATAARGLDTALRAALDGLAGQDRRAASRFASAFAPFWGSLKLDLTATQPQGYAALATVERDRLTHLCERLEARLGRGSDPWVARTAWNARRLDEWLRAVPLNWKSSDGLRFLGPATDIRDLAQAENLFWLMARRPGARLLVFGHRFHLANTRVDVGWWGRPDDPAQTQTPAGLHLRRRLGASVLNIVHTADRGRAGCEPQAEAPPADADTLDAAAERAAGGAWLLDLSDAPAQVRAWIDAGRPLGRPGERLSLHPARAFDVLFHTSVVTAACATGAPS